MATGLKTHHEVFAQIVNCHACPLRESKAVKLPVPWRGRFPNELMMIGEAPGSQENNYGKPFVGQSGVLLNRVFREVGLPHPDEWFITNAVCCRSIGKPEKESVRACQTNLRDQVHLANPSWVLLLGATALDAAQASRATITQVHGRPFEAKVGPLIGRWLFPTFHPAAGLRDEKRMREMYDDLATLNQVLRGKVTVESVAIDIGRNGKVVA